MILESGRRKEVFMHEEALEPESRYEASVTQLKGRCQDPW